MIIVLNQIRNKLSRLEEGGRFYCFKVVVIVVVVVMVREWNLVVSWFFAEASSFRTKYLSTDPEASAGQVMTIEKQIINR
jgi:hypothetical protein